MTETKITTETVWTPGPWRWAIHEEDETESMGDIVTTEGRMVAGFVEWNNADVLLAAPEMYEAAQYVVDMLTGLAQDTLHTADAQAIVVLSAALAKARGEVSS